jgi:cystathionine beta-lyase/cystathionine gamma-synthase
MGVHVCCVASGGAASLIENPASMPHPSIPRAERGKRREFRKNRRVSRSGCEERADLGQVLNLILDEMSRKNTGRIGATKAIRAPAGSAQE